MRRSRPPWPRSARAPPAAASRSTPRRLALLGSVLEAFWWQRYTAAGDGAMTPDQVEQVVDDVLLPIVAPGGRPPGGLSPPGPVRVSPPADAASGPAGVRAWRPRPRPDASSA